MKNKTYNEQKEDQENNSQQNVQEKKSNIEKKSNYLQQKMRNAKKSTKSVRQFNPPKYWKVFAQQKIESINYSFQEVLRLIEATEESERELILLINENQIYTTDYFLENKNMILQQEKKLNNSNWNSQYQLSIQSQNKNQNLGSHRDNSFNSKVSYKHAMSARNDYIRKKHSEPRIQTYQLKGNEMFTSKSQLSEQYRNSQKFIQSHESDATSDYGRRENFFNANNDEQEPYDNKIYDQFDYLNNNEDNSSEDHSNQRTHWNNFQNKFQHKKSEHSPQKSQKYKVGRRLNQQYRQQSDAYQHKIIDPGYDDYEDIEDQNINQQKKTQFQNSFHEFRGLQRKKNEFLSQEKLAQFNSLNSNDILDEQTKIQKSKINKKQIQNQKKKDIKLKRKKYNKKPILKQL